jgi:hypothetical protein
VQKGIIKDFLKGENGREQKPDWLPPYFRFPIAAHTDRGGITLMEKSKSTAELLNTPVEFVVGKEFRTF